jgi:hypothetical protein
MSDSRQGAAPVEQSPQQRQRARIAGWLMALTFLTSIPAALILYDPVLNDTGYILGAGDDTRVTLGALLEIFLMIGNVGTAVVMFPILRRYSETLSLSYVASRTIESTIIGSARSVCSPSSPCATTWPRPSARTEPRSISRGGPWSRSTTGRSCSGRDSASASTASCSAG